MNTNYELTEKEIIEYIQNLLALSDWESPAWEESQGRSVTKDEMMLYGILKNIYHMTHWNSSCVCATKENKKRCVDMYNEIKGL